MRLESSQRVYLREAGRTITPVLDMDLVSEPRLRLGVCTFSSALPYPSMLSMRRILVGTCWGARVYVRIPARMCQPWLVVGGQAAYRGRRPTRAGLILRSTTMFGKKTQSRDGGPGVES